MPARNTLWIPSLLVGASTATALATGAGLLLYDGEGLLRAALALAGVNIASMAIGLRSAGIRESESDPHAGRWWLGLLLALMGGAGFAVFWEAMNSFAAAPLAQGVGLGLTSALPAYFAAGVWARLRALEALLGTGTRRRQATFGAAAGAAAAVGLALIFLGRPVWAVTALLLAMVLASAGARLHVWILDRVPRLDRSVSEPERPALRFEEWRTVVPDSRTRAVRDHGVTRVLDPPPPGDWREGVATTLHDGRPILFVGAGSWFDPADGRRWQVYEADEGVRRVAAAGFGWEDEALAASPVPDGEGWVVVAEVVAAPSIGLDVLQEAGTRRVWIGGAPGRVGEPLLAEAREAGLGLGRYRSAVAGVAGPPHVAPRADELWCLDVGGEPPESVIGMVVAPLPAGWTAGDPEAPEGPAVSTVREPSSVPPEDTGREEP